jgi:hypothetical protein
VENLCRGGNFRFDGIGRTSPAFLLANSRGFGRVPFTLPLANFPRIGGALLACTRAVLFKIGCAAPALLLTPFCGVGCVPFTVPFATPIGVSGTVPPSLLAIFFWVRSVSAAPLLATFLEPAAVLARAHARRRSGDVG